MRSVSWQCTRPSEQSNPQDIPTRSMMLAKHSDLQKSKQGGFLTSSDASGAWEGQDLADQSIADRVDWLDAHGRERRDDAAQGADARGDGDAGDGGAGGEGRGVT